MLELIVKFVSWRHFKWDPNSKLLIYLLQIILNLKSKQSLKFPSALDASFRGLPLKGTSISVPDGFKGLIFTETNQHQAEDDERNFFLKDNFNKITYWNYDKLPSKNDAIVSALDWIHISQAVSILVLNQQW